MRHEHSPTTDPRWIALIEKYQNDWSLAAKDILGMDVTPQQKIAFDEVQKKGSTTSIAHGGGIGATSIFSAISILRVILYRHGVALIAAPQKLNAVAPGIMKYVKMHWGKALEKHQWLDIYFKRTELGLHARSFKEGWGLKFSTGRLGSEEALAGWCISHFTVLIPDAETISDRAIGILMGGLTQKDNGILLMSMPPLEKPNKKSFFYRTHHEFAKKNGGIWNAITMSAEDSPLVSPEFIEMKKEQYGGPDSNEYRQKVQGRFPLEEALA